jgi:hypothetical protein
VMPYADQRAYTDRLNALLTPAGWTRKYTVHTSANFQRGKDQKTVAKIFVTCELTILGLGSHSATGEEWADDDNAGTSAEAQAFKRACSCFGLGRYLYYFTGAWVDIDDRKRPKKIPTLPEWATPDGWRKGIRPHNDSNSRSDHQDKVSSAPAHDNRRNGAATTNESALVRQIEVLAEPLGKALYRGLLKSVARVWNPNQIQDTALEQRVLAHIAGGRTRLASPEISLGDSGDRASNENSQFASSCFPRKSGQSRNIKADCAGTRSALTSKLIPATTPPTFRILILP